MAKISFYRFLLILFILIPLHVSFAQDDTGGSPIDFTGAVESVDGTTIVVGGLPVDISGVTLSGDLTVGVNVQVSGSLVNGTVIANVVVIVQTGDDDDNDDGDDDTASQPSIDLQKFVSIDGGATWQDADESPGPDVPLGEQVAFRFVVTNDGVVDLSGITLTDSVFDLSTCTIPDTLAVGAFFECQIGPFDAVEGQHANLATVNASFAGDGTLLATDPAHYFGGDRVEVDVIKTVLVAGASSGDNDDDDRQLVPVGSNVSYRIEVVNTGNVPLTGITLNDPGYDLGACTIPESLNPNVSFECVIGPFPVEAEGEVSNTVTVTATGNDQTVTDTDTARFFGGDDESDLPVIVVIEGPIININVNVVTVYDFDIELDINDPLLNVIQIGDILRIEGEVDDDDLDGVTIIIIPITVVVINVEINIVDGSVWRDTGSCANPPPSWAPANGWRARCGGGITIIIDDDDDGSRRSSRGRGRGSGRGS